jgi:magnesium transporter
MSNRVTQEAFHDPVTRHMRPAPTKLRADETVGQSLQRIRQEPPPDRILYFYVVCPEDRLTGVVPTRRLLLAQPEQKIAEIMIAKPVAVPAAATVLDACEFFTLHRFLAFPVIDAERRLLGVVDVELYTDELAEFGSANHDDLFQLIGVHIASARQMSPWRAFRCRFPWLLCNIAGGTAAALLSGMYEAELQQVVALALFIPVVLGLAESVSIQSVSLTLEMMRGRRPSWRDLASRLSAESATGLLLGLACALALGGVAAVWIGDWRVTASLAGGIAGGVTIAALLGLAAPYVMRLIYDDPQVASGPLALALTDMATLLAYFNLARVFV